MRKQIIIDDEIGYKLDKLPNQSEFIRQAILEKFNRDKKPDAADNESAKEFMGLVTKMTKMLDNHQTMLTDIKESFLNHDAKFHLAYAKSEQQFFEVMRVILRNNIFAIQSLDSDWLKDHKSDIDDAVTSTLNEIIQRIKIDMAEVINGKK